MQMGMLFVAGDAMRHPFIGRNCAPNPAHKVKVVCVEKRVLNGKGYACRTANTLSRCSVWVGCIGSHGQLCLWR